ncbi:unnamed protein product [Sphagnum jensenii]|uniref:Uncharacterized protein n=1 Tax=Sphagnum jensenii TaxID=128206 RepID=A0ABP1A6L4_9BRYO
MTTLRLLIAFKTMVSIWVYIIGGDGTQRGANAMHEIIDKSFGFDMWQLKKLNMQSMHMQLYAHRNCSKIHALYFSREGDKTS